MAHAFVTFRIRLAQHALRQFAASLRSSAEIVLLVFAHVLIGVFALAALPPMYAASLPATLALPLLVLHALLMCVPLALLRKRVLPLDVVHWSWRLPLPPRIRLLADALVAAMLVGPLALLYALSAAIWLTQRPHWLLPARALGATALSWMLTLAASVAILALRARGPLVRGSALRSAPAPAPAPAPATYQARTLRPRLPQLWHRLFWLPFWRADNPVGLQQCALLAAAAGSALPWMLAPAGTVRGILDLSTCALLVLLTDRGDKAVREQLAYLRPVMQAWPLDARALAWLARAFTLVPALLVLALLFAAGLQQGLWTRAAGRAFLLLALAGPLLLVAIPGFTPRGRVGMVVAQILVLAAVGSELWS